MNKTFNYFRQSLEIKLVLVQSFIKQNSIQKLYLKVQVNINLKLVLNYL